MLYELLLSLFVVVAILLILIIMIQQSKGSMGFGSLGGQAQMLFGGSGGQDMFQKITWVLAAIFMFGSFGLALMKHHQAQSSHYLANRDIAVYKKSASESHEKTAETEVVQQPAESSQPTENN